ncbi:hypothetical protein BOX15_Mlig014274g2 [Macrostomum lignano]|uniref:Doublecortin domain-containing protein n=1 Tax=Macrostomum lignano TaxID=282301 RepID=A0A267G0Z5_9PLAT|nr:hypothetical protein BOX15_Mlig014274g2 [Macrostomum lignano]
MYSALRLRLTPTPAAAAQSHKEPAATAVAHSVADFEAAAMRAAERAADAAAADRRYVFVAQTSATSRTEQDEAAGQRRAAQRQQPRDLSDSEMDDFTAPPAHFNDASGHHPDGVLPAKRGRLVTFYRNGDPHYKGLSASISQRAFVSMESLLVWLNEKIPTTAGVQHVFRLPDGRLMRDVGEFQPGCQYVVSSVQKLIRNVDYGGKGANPWRSKKTSAKAGKITRADIRLIRDAKGFADENEAQSLGTASSKKGTPALAGRVTKTRVITVISNSHRSSREKVLVNPSTMQNFEDMLLDFTNLLVMSKPPVQTLYTARPPYKRVCSFSQLFREFKDHDTFIACGREFAPSELGNKREAPPSSNSSEDALNGVRGGGDVGGASGANMGFASPPEMDHRKPRKQFRRAEDRYQDLDTNRTSRTTAARPQPVPVSVPIRGRGMTFYAPTVRETQHRQPPDQALRLDWVYGFTGGDSAAVGAAADSLLHALPTGELVYAVANTAVVFDPEGHRQRHYTEHTGPIVCMDIHPTKSVIVTGQRSVPELRVDAQLRIWDAEGLGTFVALGDADLFQSCVTSLNFSTESQGAYLLALDGVANGHRQTMFIFDWQTRRLVAKTKTSREPVRRAVFHPDDDSSLVSLGRRHVHFWRIFQEEDGRSRILRDKKSGLFEASPPDDVLSLSFDLVGNAITGDSSGCLNLWVRDEEDAFVLRSLDHLQRAHRGPITCLRILGDGTLLSTSGSCIRAWDTLNDYSLVKERILNESTESLVALAVKSPRSSDGRLVMATSSNSLLEGSLQDRFSCVVQGHSLGPGLGVANGAVSVATHPREHSIVTCAGDRGVCKWSTLHRRLQWRAVVELPCTCACFHPRGHLVGIGRTLAASSCCTARPGRTRSHHRWCRPSTRPDS